MLLCTVGAWAHLRESSAYYVSICCRCEAHVKRGEVHMLLCHVGMRANLRKLGLFIVLCSVGKSAHVQETRASNFFCNGQGPFMGAIAHILLYYTMCVFVYILYSYML